MGLLTVRVLTEGVHSGDASGIVPSSFRILRSLISRVEDETTGEIKLQDLYAQVPPQRIEQAKAAAKVLGDAVYSKMPFAGKTKPMNEDLTQLVLNRTWRPALAVTGMEGYPQPKDGGNVLLPYSTAKLSFRLPPTVDGEKATKAIRKTLEENPPYGAEVEFDAEQGQGGWNAPQLAPWRSRRGWRNRSQKQAKLHLANRRPIWAKGARFRSWACSARNFPRPSSSSQACSGRRATRTARTNSSTSPPAKR
jgi:hypothetical protein